MKQRLIHVKDSTGQEYKLELILEKVTDQVECYRIKGKTRSLLFRNNRPQLKNLNSRKKVDWKLIEGELKDQKLLQNILTEIQSIIKAEETPSLIEYIRTKKSY